MPANTSHGLPYPLGTDRVMDGDDAIRGLAEALDPAASPAALAAQAGWTVQSSSCWKLGALCIVTASVTRTGADLVAGAQGNLTDANVCGPVPANMIPPERVYAVNFQSSAANGGGRVNGTAQGATAGLITLATMYPGSTLASGAALDLYAVYMLA